MSSSYPREYHDEDTREFYSLWTIQHQRVLTDPTGPLCFCCKRCSRSSPWSRTCSYCMALCLSSRPSTSETGACTRCSSLWRERSSADTSCIPFPWSRGGWPRPASGSETPPHRNRAASWNHRTAAAVCWMRRPCGLAGTNAQRLAWFVSTDHQ